MTRILKHICLLLIFGFAQTYSYSQNINDSLVAFISSAPDDTIKLDALSNLSYRLRKTGDYKKALQYANQELDLANRLNFRKGIPIALSNIGLTFYKQGNYSEALSYYFKALRIDEELNDKKGIAADYGNIGIIYRTEGNYPKALEYYFKALKIAEELNEKSTIANNISNIGNVYNKQANYTKALEFYFKALAIDEELKDKNGIAYDFNNIGNVYYLQKEYKLSLTYYLKSLELKKQMNDKKGIAVTLGNIADIYTKENNYPVALEYLNAGLLIAKEIGSKDDIKESYSGLSEVYSKTGDYQKAFSFYKLYSEIKDSLFNEESTRQVAEMQALYDTEKKDYEIGLLNKEKEKQAIVSDEQNRRQKLIILFVSSGMVLVLLFALFVFRSNRQKQKTNTALAEKNAVIAQQKAVVELKNKNITDSIIYAKRIQQAILPPIKLVKQTLPESFILYEPKDIVAGDFYWMEISEENIFIAAADCTGHGVPGAMVSVVCANALSRAVKEFGISDPGKILDKARMLVLETFEKSESEVKDGMDISVCVLNRQSGKLDWAGANNPLWYIHDNEIMEITANKQSIGQTDNPKPFTTHSIALSKGDSIYLFTDGYADQFGGPEGKKLKYKKMKDTILSNAGRSMKEQQEILYKTLVSWKGELEQVDDILIIGFKI